MGSWSVTGLRSGGGKVAKFGLKDKATALGAEVALLEGPGIIDVARINLAAAWLMLVVAEVLAANSGLAYRVLRAQRFHAVDSMFALLIASRIPCSELLVLSMVTVPEVCTLRLITIPLVPRSLSRMLPLVSVM